MRASLPRRLWWRLTLGSGWDTDRRSIRHARLGELHFEGTRDRPGGRVLGFWYATHPVSPRRISVAFPTMGGEPTPFYLDRLADMLDGGDALFERLRGAIAPVFEETVESALPADWRSVMHIDGLDVPPAPEDIDEDGALWQVSYWCEPALHWIVVQLDGETIVDVGLSG